MTWRWAVLILGSLVLAWPIASLDVPAAPLFAGLIAAVGVSSFTGVPYPSRFPRFGQSILGIQIGLLFNHLALAGMLQHWFSVLLISAGTLLLSLACGLLFSQWAGVSKGTGLLAMTAGGAAGITSIAQELGTETGLVAVLQYLRVVVVMMSLPIAVLWIFAEPVYISTLPTQTPGNWPGSLLLLVLGGLSAPIAKRLHLAAPYLLGPLLVTLILTATGYNPTPALPSVLLYLAYLFIGWQAGLQLSISRLLGYRFLLPRALLLIVFLNLLCALLGLALAHLAAILFI